VDDEEAVGDGVGGGGGRPEKHFSWAEQEEGESPILSSHIIILPSVQYLNHRAAAGLRPTSG
jgi:hypothetical protein